MRVYNVLRFNHKLPPLRRFRKSEVLVNAFEAISRSKHSNYKHNLQATNFPWYKRGAIDLFRVLDAKRMFFLSFNSLSVSFSLVNKVIR